MNIFTIFDKLKDTFRFWVSVMSCQRFSSSPFHTQDTVTKSCISQAKTRGAVTWGSYFSSLGWQYFPAQVSVDLDFWIFVTFSKIRKKGIIVGGKS
jgi:hypothetical protein